MPVTPAEASLPRVVVIEDQLCEALNVLLYSKYKNGKAVIYQEDVAELIGYMRWDLGRHPKKLREVMKTFEASGWTITDSTDNPHVPRWTFTSV